MIWFLVACSVLGLAIYAPVILVAVLAGGVAALVTVQVIVAVMWVALWARVWWSTRARKLTS